MARLLSSRSGSKIIGLQSGSPKAGEQRLVPPFAKAGEDRTLFRHNEDSFRQLWKEVGDRIGTRFTVWAEFESEEKVKAEESGQKKVYFQDGARKLYFLVEKA